MSTGSPGRSPLRPRMRPQHTANYVPRHRGFEVTKSRFAWASMAILMLALFAGGAFSFLSQGSASAASVAPVYVAGNPSCTGLGYDAGYKIDPPTAGTYNATVFGVAVTITLATDGTYFDWTSTFPVSAVISKGGPNANVYVYDPPATSLADTGLHSPINPENTRPFGLSHVEICFNKLASDTTTELHLEPGHTVFAVGASVPFGSSVHDKATVTGVTGYTPTGSVTFDFFNNATCTGTPVSTSVVALDGSGGAHPSQSATNLTEGSYGFLATYGGSALYDGSAESCEYFRVKENPQTAINVDKTANGVWDQECTWEIDKSVSPGTLDLFKGDSGTVEYTVEVDLVDCLTEVSYRITGTITVSNDSDLDTYEVTDVTDILGGDLDCTLPATLGPGDDLVCNYEILDATGDETINTATATVDGATVEGTEVSVGWAFSGTYINDEINVDDTVEGDLGTFDDDDLVTYTRTFTCDEDEGDHDNTATIVETEQDASASVTVNCYDLTVTKDADTALTRTWTWSIDKSADQSDLLLSGGQLFTVNYEVTVDATSADSERAVSGTITVSNPAPIAATINTVSDIISPDINGNADCGVTFPYALAAGDSLNCTYTASLPDATARTNTATATLQNYDYDEDGIATASGTTDFTGTANVSFAAPTITEVDECIDVSDTNTGVLGTVCAGDAPQTFKYSLTFGTHPDADVLLVCGDNSHVNTASFETNDTSATGSDEWTVDADVACLGGCTLTQGYWKTHSELGPAPYDDAWLLLGDADGDGTSEGQDETFFLSGQTYYQVLWTAPAGNVYYNLAHQYIAAKLNILNGADTTPAVVAAITYAENSFFNTYTPATAAALKGGAKNTANGYANTLDQFNNGLIGPGHCSE